MTDAAIQVQGLVKAYHGVRAVDGLDLTIPRGEVFALLGPNGAGKSTTVEILEGFRGRDAGEVSVLGIDPVMATRSWRERVGIMLQSTSPRSFLNAREALTHASRLYSNPRDVEEMLDAVGLTDKAEEKPQELSGGQRRRLDVALALIGRPELVFLDEPTTGFDPEARRQFWRLVESIAADGTTVLLTTHYLDEADHLADRIGIISSGRLVALDTPEGLRRRAAGARVSWREDGELRTQVTPTPTAVLRELLERHSGEVEHLEVVHPSLEDVYLDLIGDTTAEADAATPPHDTHVADEEGVA
ncbi:ABC transporter ATP-binding protein [Demequina sp. B12]|uniref:ABC transporter ATP-binding protein n=1 Tax=Demequina sp. B12 TaxID=2992757 RepID=UPI00237AF1B8|nr:ABC transporter ATP-binding protein [Demequina sp. B12]MDE0572414.1 ABC transporter ATP-binding protein [Demequina sp. B12]